MQSHDNTQSSDESIAQHAQSIKIDNVEKKIKRIETAQISSKNN